MKINLGTVSNALIQLFGGWESITSQVDAWAIANSKPTYSSDPGNYSFRSPGLVGFPPKVSFNVYFVRDGQTIDLGKIVAN
jgi:hypothetical protein